MRCRRKVRLVRHITGCASPGTWLPAESKWIFVRFLGGLWTLSIDLQPAAMKNKQVSHTEKKNNLSLPLTGCSKQQNSELRLNITKTKQNLKMHFWFWPLKVLRISTVHHRFILELLSISSSVPVWEVGEGAGILCMNNMQAVCNRINQRNQGFDLCKWKPLRYCWNSEIFLNRGKYTSKLVYEELSLTQEVRTH